MEVRQENAFRTPNRVSLLKYCRYIGDIRFMKTKRPLLLPFAVSAFSLASCAGGQNQSSGSSSSASSAVASIDSSSSEEQSDVYSAKEAIVLADDSSTTDKVDLVKGKVVSFQNYCYGQLTLGDDEGNTQYVYLESMANEQIELDLAFVCWDGKDF